MSNMEGAMTPGRTARLLPLAAIGGSILFDVAWMLMGHLRVGYSSLSRPISALAIGADGVFVRTAFLLYGALVTVGTVSALRSVKQELGAVAHWACTLLLILSPLGILWAGIFTMDAMVFHIAGAQVGCGTPIIVLPIAGLLLRRAPSWRRFGTWMLLGGPLTIALTAGFMQSVPLSAMATGGGTFGLWQRALFLEIQAWYVAIAWMALREPKRMSKSFGSPTREGREGAPAVTAIGHAALIAPANARTSPRAIWLARGSIAGALIFAATWAILGLLRPGYSFVSQPISGLGLGPGAAMMNGAFILTGLLFVAGPIGSFMLTRDLGALARWSSAIMLALSGVGAILCGLFTWESFAPHMIGSALGLAGPILGFFVAGLVLRRSTQWRRLGGGLLAAAALTLILVVVFFATFSVEAVLASRGVAGLIERLLVVEIHAWYIALALATTKQDAPRKAYKGPPMEGFIASWYAKNTKSEARAQRENARSIADRVPAGGRVLEVAPGPGYLAIELAQLGRHEVFGLDISRTFVRIATENARQARVAVEFRHGNASEMPYPDASFDFVVCRAAFKNFSDPMGALNEIHRVLRPGGRASVLDLRRESSPQEIRALVARMDLPPLGSFWTKLTFRFFLLKNAYSRDAIECMATHSRFGTCEVRDIGIEFDLRLAKA
jgi:ubiquinone/menaquinone biosynthesis C-methylase UbiE/hypothetical membrane protein